MSSEPDTILADIEAFLAVKRMAQTVFGKAAVNDPGLVGQMRKGIAIGPRRQAKIRAFMDANSSASAQRLLAEVKQEADDAAAGRLRTTPLRAAHLPARLTPAETIQTMLVDTPSDAVLALKRRWPDLWADIVITARSHDVLPGEMMVNAIEAGLASIGLAAAALAHVQKGGAADLTLRQLGLLAILCEPGRPEARRTVRALSVELGVQKPIITRAVDRFEKLGFVDRAPDPTDRRSIILSATPAGRHLRDALRGA